MKKLKNWRPALLALGAAAAGVLVLARGAEAAQGVRRGLELCGGIVIPSLFPFMVLSAFLTKSGLSRVLGRPVGLISRPLFRLPGAAGTAVLLSYISGYPVGGRMAVQLYESGQVTLAQTRRMLYFTINAGPAMILSAVGAGMLGSPRAGVILLVSHILASVLIGVAIAHLPGSRKEESVPHRASGDASARTCLLDAFVEAAADASSGMLGICAFVVLFAAVLGMLPPLSGITGAAVSGLLEVTSGCGAAVGAALGLPAIAAMLGWGGLSVHCQVLSSAYRLRPSMPKFLLARAAHAGLSYLLCSLLLPLSGGAVETISNGVQAFASACTVSMPASAALLLMGAVLLWSLSHKSAE